MRAIKPTGVALVAVLLLTSLLSIIAVAVLGIARTRAQILAHQFESIQLAETLDSALRLALHELAFPRDGATVSSSAPDIRTFTLFGQSVETTLEFESWRVDLNAADSLLLASVFVASGVSESQAQSYANRILDWRDVDESISPGGAERADYANAKLNYGPRNGEFESAEELRRIIGLANVSDAVLESFTVYSRQPAPSASSPLANVQRALRWRDASTNGSTRLSDPEQSATRDNDRVSSLAGEVVRVKACPISKQKTFCRIAIVRFTGNINHPYLTYAWHTTYRRSDEVS